MPWAVSHPTPHVPGDALLVVCATQLTLRATAIESSAQAMRLQEEEVRMLLAAWYRFSCDPHCCAAQQARRAAAIADR